MSLFGSLRLGSNTLQAMQIGLHVVGNNIANANTPGYIREEVNYTPAPVYRKGALVLGLGVAIDGIEQVVDRFAVERLRGSQSELAGANVSEKAYKDLERLIGELSDTDLSTSLTEFFSSIHEVQNSPADASVRNLAVLAGESLAADFNRLHQRAEDISNNYNQRIENISGEVNNLALSIRKLNVRIANIEGGKSGTSDAGGLRTLRNENLSQLAQIVNIHATEQPSGAINVAIGGEFLVFEGNSRLVEVRKTDVDGNAETTLIFTDTKSPVKVFGGELGGLYDARDKIVGSFIEDIDQLASTLSNEFNRVYSEGQGLKGFKTVTGVNQLLDLEKPLDEIDLNYPPENGSFEIYVKNTNTGITKTHSIRIDLNGFDHDTTGQDLISQLNAIDGLEAVVDVQKHLTIKQSTQDVEFAFGNDTSGLLTSLGINTFFVGSSANGLGVNKNLHGVENANKFAASSGGLGKDTRNGERLASFFNRSLDSQNGVSLHEKYSQLVNGIVQESAVAGSVAKGLQAFSDTLESEVQAVSGVNLDEEAIRMISLQRSYQASARFIKTISELLDIVVNL